MFGKLFSKKKENMDKENVVSIWIGNFKSENEFAEFVKEQYDDEGDLLPSTFMKMFRIDYIDSDSQEILFQENLSKEDLLQASYAETFINKMGNISGNSIVLLYDFCYTGQVKEAENLYFIGTFDYNK